MKALNFLGLFILFGVSIFDAKAQSRAGDISPAAKYIDADNLNPFSGAAIIQKGSATALIDPAGNILCPYGKYNFSPAYSNCSLFTANNNLVNDKGQVLAARATVPPGWKIGKLYNDGDDSKTVFVDAAGKKYIMPMARGMQIKEVSENVVLVTQMGQQQKYGTDMQIFYKTLDGKPLTNDIFDECNSFQNGLALVGKMDQYGAKKYGYIDTRGNIAVPLQYSVRPSNFSNGFALVIPRQPGNDFLFAIINRNGEIKAKVTAQMQQALRFTTAPLVLRCGLFCSASWSAGTSYKSYVMLDTMGRLVSFKDVFEANNGNHITIPDNTTLLIAKTNAARDLYYYMGLTVQKKDSRGGWPSYYGFINTDKKIVIPPIFANALEFDPITKLAYAKMLVAGSNGQPDKYREGYINDEGVFVILKNENKSVF